MPDYQCPVCQVEIQRDMTLFLDHTNKHIIDAIKKQHPDWVEKNGACPKCVEHYEKSKRVK